MRAQFMFHEVWIGLRRNLTMTIALIVVVAISLSLLGTGLLFVKQVNHTRSFWQQRVQLAVYLCGGGVVADPSCGGKKVTPAQIGTLTSQLKALPQVRAVTYISPEQGYKQFLRDFPRKQALAANTSPADIPAALQVKLRNAQTGEAAVVEAMAGQPGVDQVGSNATVLDKIYRLLDGARNAVVIVAIILLIAAILLVANTIRLSAFSRRRETSIMRLVGASNLTVQLPFLLEGAIAGLCGAILASGLLIAGQAALNGLQQYFTLHVQLSTTDLAEVIALAVLMGVLLCGATSFLTLRRYLRV